MFGLTIVVWSFTENHELHDGMVHLQDSDGFAVHDG